jgi:uncharacterized protein
LATSPDLLPLNEEILDVTAHLSPIKAVFAAAFFLAAGSLAAQADDQPTPAALESAHTIIIASGLTRSFDIVIPQTFGELERSVTVTRPELKDNLHAVLLALVPEFGKTERDLVNSAALVLARRMSEQELKDTANFFLSPSGKKYVDVQPAAIGEIIALADSWRQKLSTDVLTRAREEMRKNGQDL